MVNSVVVSLVYDLLTLYGPQVVLGEKASNPLAVRI
jgi:hypothetical protein